MNFSGTDLGLLGSSITLLVFAFLFFNKRKQSLSVGLLFFCSLVLAYFMARLDPFLNLWDERFHALVAKNILLHPFKPTLYEHPILGYDYRIWAGNHVWLHKQPMFLWQIALSLKLFDINEVAVRLPSVLMHGILSVLIFRIGKICCSSKVGFYGAAFFSVAYYPLELVVGKFPTDHNDISFMFYVTATFWAWFEYRNSSHPIWILLIGLFSGLSILVKWLVGWLIFPLWVLVTAWDWKNEGIEFKKLRPIFLSFGICCLTFLPWQLYIMKVFPQESAYEFNLNTQHFYKAVENHGGDFWFHFKALKKIYGAGDAVPFILLSCIIYFVFRLQTVYRIMVVGAVFTVYGFYTMATTKMVSFCLIVSPFVFLGIGSAFEGIEDLIGQKIKARVMERVLGGCLFLTLCFLLNDFNKIQNSHSFIKPGENGGRHFFLEEMKFIEETKIKLKGEPHVIFNSSIQVGGEIALMFYTTYIAYDFVPNQQQLKTVKESGYKIAIRDDGKLPEYIKEDKAIKKLKFGASSY
jgi:4-amino-4-deoxy-L-arabinose transferase-like glycosyltransferase